MNAIKDERTKKLEEADMNLETMRNSIEKMKALGMDVRDMERTYKYLDNQISILKRP